MQDSLELDRVQKGDSQKGAPSIIVAIMRKWNPSGMLATGEAWVKAVELAFANYWCSNLLLDKRQVHNPLRGAHFNAEGTIRKYLGDDAAISSGKTYQEATSEAHSKRAHAHFDSPAGSVTKEKMATAVPIYLPHRSLDTR